MAGFLLRREGRASFVVAALLMMSSCLSPQTINPTPVAPRLSPVIDSTSLSPSVAVVCLSDQLGSPQYNFSALIRSTDGKPLSVRWFIDYDPNKATTITAYDRVDLDPAQNGGLNLFNVTFGGSELGFDSSAVGVHTLEVVVATSFDQTEGAKPPNRAIAPGGWATSYKWVINYVGMNPCANPS